MKIRLAISNEVKQIAKIHCQEIKYGFLTQLGEKLLSKLYQSIILSPSSFIVVAEDNNQVIGFISGSTNINKFYKEFIKKYFLKTFFILLPKIFKPSAIKKIIETLCYPQKEKYLTSSELLTIAVKKESQNKDIAKLMLERFILEMEKRQIKQFKVIVGENLLNAINFYEKAGFIFHSFISVHKNKSSKIYIYKLK
ncbi:MAG: GNAT family N-acetyltransferase [Bacteroidetes bacterium]|nr:GNAT family N-acetyltransferase [Bacteroidota bacterium]